MRWPLAHLPWALRLTFSGAPDVHETLADRVFEGGPEIGTHEGLMVREGEYAVLFRAQAHWYQ